MPSIHPQPSQPLQPRPEYRPQPPQPQSRPLQPHPQRPIEERISTEASRPNVPSQPRPSSVSLNEALKNGPVNFRGRRIEEKRERPKVEVDTDALKKVLE